jgi:hypothetical protein
VVTTFLLSPAHVGGRRAQQLLSASAAFPLARRLQHGEGAPLGEVFSFVSGLYFRGKLAYAEHFADPGTVPLVITTDRGLMASDRFISARDLRQFSATPIDADDPWYRSALERDARALTAGRVVFLGSIATRKYLAVLTELLGDRLYYPAAFAGIGDMSRGSLLLKAVRSNEELDYLPADTLPFDVRRRRHG